ncbi:GNAT family N-acetyltransferase [Nocardioides dongkuii]|uniref:GNAT family N-acetyltransferase n=1 Tax=Nocardioides dongkuii TaxID=2760089 RepID=UPI0015FC253F|nr:GNAT family protein [Nocardioides dongkuii]
MPTTNDHGQQVGDEVAGWSPRDLPRPTLLEGRYVRLEPLGGSHAEPLHASLCGPEDAPLWTYRTAEPPTDVAEMARLVAAHAGDTDTVTWAIVPEGRSAEGLATFMRIDPDHGQVEVAGVLFARTLQRTRAATEAIHLFLRYAFEDLGYRRVEWKCDSLNEPSRRAAQRLGFTYEGRFRQHLVVKGRNRDTDWFSVTDTEWPEVRAAHEAWLDPANFEADGTQRAPLARRPGPTPGP